MLRGPLPRLSDMRADSITVLGLLPPHRSPTVHSIPGPRRSASREFRQPHAWQILPRIAARHAWPKIYRNRQSSLDPFHPNHHLLKRLKREEIARRIGLVTEHRVLRYACPTFHHLACTHRIFPDHPDADDLPPKPHPVSMRRESVARSASQNATLCKFVEHGAARRIVS